MVFILLPVGLGLPQWKDLAGGERQKKWNILSYQKIFFLLLFIRCRNLFENIGKYFLFSGAHINLWQSRRKTGRSTSSSVPTHCFHFPQIIGCHIFCFHLVNVEANHCLYTNSSPFTTQLPIAGASSCFSPWLGWDFDTLWILPLIRDHPIWSQIQNVESSSGDSFPAHYRSWVPASRQPVPRCAHQHHRPPGLWQLPHLWKTLGWQLHHQERGQEIAGERDCLWRWSGDSQLLLGMPRSAGEKSTSTLWILWGE